MNDTPQQPFWPVDLQTPAPEILYFEQECLVINKPGGVLTQSPPGVPSIEAQARRFFHQIRDTNTGSSAETIAEADYVGVPHRLDRATSGALLLGQSKAVTRKLAAQFERRTIRKFYWVLVAGTLAEPTGTWCDWMRKRPDHALSEIANQADPAAQAAELSYRVLASENHISLLEIELKTGRTHQIRLQASSRGLPILGDSWYGSQVPFGPWFDDERKRSIALHARVLDFWHPKLHHPVAVLAPTPTTWADFVATNSPTILPLLSRTDLL